MSRYESMQDLIGNTPIVKLGKIGEGYTSEIYAKLELANPSGSVKDRTGKYMIEDAERKGLLKPGGTIASVTTMNFMPPAMDPGVYPANCTWYQPFRSLAQKLFTAYNKLDPMQGYIPGIKPDRMPRFFASQGIQRICAYPIGKMDSWSNAAIPKEQKLRWLDLYYRSEVDRLEAFMALPEMRENFTEAEAARYRELLDEKCAWLRAHPDENEVWEWQGGANLLITGIRP